MKERTRYKKTVRYKFEGRGPPKTITVKDGWALRETWRGMKLAKKEMEVFDPHHAQTSQDGAYSPSDMRTEQAYNQLEQELNKTDPTSNIEERWAQTGYLVSETKELSSKPQTDQQRYDEYYSKKAAKKHGKKFYESAGLEAFNK